MRETGPRGIEAVIRIVVVALADIAQQNVTRAGFYFKIVVQPLLDVDGFAGRQADLGAGRDGVGTAVGMDRDVGCVVDLLVGQAVVDTDEDIAAAAVDDILSLIPVEMVGGVLTFFQEQQLLGVDLGVLVRHSAVAVADSDQGEAEFIKVAQTVVGNIPAQHALADFVILMALLLPLGWGEMAERRQGKLIFVHHCFQFLQCHIDLAAFH